MHSLYKEKVKSGNGTKQILEKSDISKETKGKKRKKHVWLSGRLHIEGRLNKFQVFSTQVLAFVTPTCWVRQSCHASTSLPSILLLTCVCLPSIPPLLASGTTFSAAAIFQVCYRRHGCRGKQFRFVGAHHRQSMLLAGLHCQHRRVLASIDVMKEH